VAVSLAPVHVAGCQLGHNDERALGLTEPHRLRGELCGAGCRGASDRDVEAEAMRADRILNFDRDRRIQPLEIGAAEHDEIDILAVASRCLERALRSVHRVLGLHAELILGTVLDVGAHPFRIEQTRLVVNVAALDARRLLDELRPRLLQRLVRVRRVVATNELVERGDQLVVREDVIGVPHSVAGDRGTSGLPGRHGGGFLAHDLAAVH
jgi:hypothetical protein